MNRSFLIFVMVGWMWSCADSNPAKLPHRAADAGAPDTGGISGSGDGAVSDVAVGTSVDMGTEPADQGVADGGTVVTLDTGMTGGDMGSAVDANSPESDGQTPEPDAQPPEPDAQPPEPDAQPLEPDMACVTDCDGDGISIEDGDCNDDDPTIFPGQPEHCDGIDNNCADGVDENVTRGCYAGAEGTRGVGLCQGGIERCQDGVFGACEGQVVPVDEVCGDALDNNCDGDADEDCDQDMDGVTTTQGDCRDDLATVNPTLPEVCDGLDNNCDDVVDGIEEACYSGPDGTEDVGVCRGGNRVCQDGAFGACAGETVPGDEACENEIDDDCDGRVDENCQVDACPDLADGVAVVSSASCLVAGTGAQALVQVRLVDPNGANFNNADVQFGIQPDGNAGPTQQVGNTYYRVLNTLPEAGEIRVNVSVGCEDGSRLALQPEQVIQVVANDAVGDQTRTGGCAGIQGHLRVRVINAATGQPIAQPWVQVGNRGDPALASDAAAVVRGQDAAGARTVRGDAQGVVDLLDFADGLSGPQTVTVGASGFENVSLVGVNGSAMTIALRSSVAPGPQPATTGGRMIDFDDLGRDGQADMGLVLRSFDMEFLSTFAFSRLLSRLDCWDPVTAGFAGGFVDPTAVPGNLYVPQQAERIGILPATIDQHRFTLHDLPNGRDNLVALAGKVPVGEVVGILSGGGSLSQILQLLTPGEIGVRKNVDLAQARNDLDISLATPLAQNARCRFRNAPALTGMFCISAGDWSGGPGTGRLFPMGLATMDAAAVGRGGANFLELPLTTVANAGEFQGVSYMGALIALFPDADDAPAGQAYAVSAILDRSSLGANGGVISGDSFLSTTIVSRDGLSVDWNAVGNGNSPAVDLCRVDIVRLVWSEYNPGGCSPNRFATTEVPVWSAMVAGDPGELTLPSVPGAWPNGATAGIIDPRATMERDSLQVRLTCSVLGRVENFNLNRTAFDALLNGLTHASSNTVNY